MKLLTLLTSLILLGSFADARPRTPERRKPSLPTALHKSFDEINKIIHLIQEESILQDNDKIISINKVGHQGYIVSSDQCVLQINVDYRRPVWPPVAAVTIKDISCHQSD